MIFVRHNDTITIFPKQKELAAKTRGILSKNFWASSASKNGNGDNFTNKNKIVTKSVEEPSAAIKLQNEN